MSDKSKKINTSTENRGNEKSTEIKEMSKTTKYAFIAVVLVALVIAIVILWEPMMGFLKDPATFADKIKAMGWPGVIVFFFINAIHVFMPIIPAGPFSIAAGLVWGSWFGTAICLVSSTFFATLLYLWIKKANPAIARQILQSKRMEGFQKYLKAGRVGKTMLLFFLIPGSPKDFLAWIAGLLEISLPEWILINMVGRFPGVFLPAASVSGLKNGNYGVVALVVIIGILFYFGGSRLKNKYLPDDEEVEEAVKAE